MSDNGWRTVPVMEQEEIDLLHADEKWKFIFHFCT